MYTTAAAAPCSCSPHAGQEFAMESSAQFVLHEEIITIEELQDPGSPLYVGVYEPDVDSPRRRPTKVPHALPLQKVASRNPTENDWEVEDDDEEVIIFMDGILTKVGKPSGPTNSGKLLSTVQTCPITVKWLLENFESMVGQSLPRSFVYDQYVAHCGVNKIESVNAASFGKLIRSVFLGLRTRRLGTRGNSKYHYYGIKIKESSHLLPILNSIRAEQDLLNDTVNGRIRKRVRRTQSVYTGKHVKGLTIDKKVEVQENLGILEFQCPDVTLVKNVEGLTDGVDAISLSIFEDLYKRHCTRLVEFFHGFKLIDVLSEIANFWRLTLSFKRKTLEDYSAILPKPTLFKMSSLKTVEEFVVRMDLYIYQHIINVLTPSVLRPLPLQMLQAVDNMFQDILGIFALALNGFPSRFVYEKLRTLTAFVRMWKQYSKMSQLSEFVELTLENTHSVSSMRHNIKSIVLEHICDRASVIVESNVVNSVLILNMMKSFAEALEKEQSLDLWCEWAQDEIIAAFGIVEESSIEDIELYTADMHSSWLIISNLVVNAIREMCGYESSLFVPLFQWCGELMQYFRQRLLDSMKEVTPVTRFYISLKDEDMSVSFLDRYRAKSTPLVTTKPEEEDFSMPVFVPSSVRLLNSGDMINTETTEDIVNSFV